MTNMKNLSYLTCIMILSVFLFSGCGGDDDGPGNCSVAWATDLQNELNAIVTASTNYSNDPSASNCTALKAAYTAYINALRPYGNCSALTGQDRAAWEQAIEDAEDDVDTIC